MGSGSPGQFNPGRVGRPKRAGVWAPWPRVDRQRLDPLGPGSPQTRTRGVCTCGAGAGLRRCGPPMRHQDPVCGLRLCRRAAQPGAPRAGTGIQDPSGLSLVSTVEEKRDGDGLGLGGLWGLPTRGLCPEHPRRRPLSSPQSETEARGQLWPGTAASPALLPCMFAGGLTGAPPVSSPVGRVRGQHPGFLALASHSCVDWSLTLPAIKSQGSPRTVVHPTPRPCQPGGPSRHTFVLSKLGWERVCACHRAPSPASTPRSLLLGA